MFLTFVINKYIFLSILEIVLKVPISTSLTVNPILITYLYNTFVIINEKLIHCYQLKSIDNLDFLGFYLVFILCSRILSGIPEIQLLCLFRVFWDCSFEEYWAGIMKDALLLNFFLCVSNGQLQVMAFGEEIQRNKFRFHSCLNCFSFGCCAL